MRIAGHAHALGGAGEDHVAGVAILHPLTVEWVVTRSGPCPDAPRIPHKLMYSRIPSTAVLATA
jgi:hypothetical protein